MTDRLDIDAARSRLTELDAEINRLRQLLPEEAKRGPAGEMSCPRCATAMEPGTAVVKGTMWGFLLVGMSYQHLYFQGDWTDQDECLMTSGVSERGYRCPKCRLLMIQTRGR